MLNNDIIYRLEHVEVPDITLEGYRENLRSVLVKEHAMTYGERAQTRRFMNPVWRSVFVTSAAWVVILVAVVFGVIIPGFQSSSVEAKAIEMVMASPEIQSILAGEQARSVTVTDTGNNLLEVLVESHGGRFIIAKVRIVDDNVRISEISYVILMGSIFVPDLPITGNNLERVIQTGKSDAAFRQLIENGADVIQAVYVECLVTTRNLENDESLNATETWAIVTLQQGDESYHFYIDFEHNRVIDRSYRKKP
jgi:hypothetical protein